MIDKISTPTTLTPAKLAQLEEAAQNLEVTFATEMLKAAGFDTPMAGLGAGPAEEQFGSFLLEERARALVEAGGFGLSETILSNLIRIEENK